MESEKAQEAGRRHDIDLKKWEKKKGTHLGDRSKMKKKTVKKNDSEGECKEYVIIKLV